MVQAYGSEEAYAHFDNQNIFLLEQFFFQIYIALGIFHREQKCFTVFTWAEDISGYKT
jgi:hypothetical protein